LKFPYKIFSLGDSAVTLELGTNISRELNEKALGIQKRLLEQPFAGLKDVWVAYSSVTLIYDPVEVKKTYNPEKTIFSYISTLLQKVSSETDHHAASGRKMRIPVCYDQEYAMDLQALAEQKQLNPETIIELHTSKNYRVYMIGFLPGFSYMAEVDERLVIPRKPQPVTVMAGSVGITGSQTGIYPVQCPGGWYIIGRTPYRLFDQQSENPVLLEAGDEVEFYRISRGEFQDISRQQNLSSI
jgi:inhibitor of KinA